MKLIKEYTEYQNLDVISESADDGEKTYRITGPFMQAEVKNRNGRVYSYPLMEREIKTYNQEKIVHNRAIGQLDHPSTPGIDLDRISHVVEKLDLVGNDGIGVAKILKSQPMGRIAHGLLSEGIKLGVSTRGVGSMNGNRVNDDFKLIAIDIVADPSAPNAFVEGILENKDYMVTDNGIVEVAINNLQKTMDDKGMAVAREAMFEFLNELKKNL